MKKVLQLTSLLLILLSSCSENIEQKAAEHLNTAKAAFQAGSYNIAKQEIDSIRILYPKAFESRRQALELMRQVEEAEQLRTIAYEDSIIAKAQETFESIRGNYVYEKDEKYQDLGIYSIKSQAVTRNYERNYIRGQVDEQGRMTLISNWTGKAYVHHNRLRFSVGESYVETEESDSRHEFTDLGIAYEKCSFTSKTDGGAAAFIAANRDSRIEIWQLGEKYRFQMVMNPADREAIARLYDLSVVLSAIQEHQKLREEASRKLEFVRSKMNGESEEQTIQQNQ